MATEAIILLLKSVGAGLLLAVPVGPMAMLCLRRGLTLGTAAGLVTGIGIATADALFAAIAAFGLGAASAFVADAAWLVDVGGLVLIALGLKDMIPGATITSAPSLAGELGAYAGAVLLTLTNPATILTFAAVIVGLGLVPDLVSPIQGAIFVAGVFVGSAAWWMLLSTAAGKFGDRLSAGAIRWTRRAAGCAFIAFGLYAILG